MTKIILLCALEGRRDVWDEVVLPLPLQGHIVFHIPAWKMGLVPGYRGSRWRSLGVRRQQCDFVGVTVAPRSMEMGMEKRSRQKN